MKESFQSSTQKKVFRHIKSDRIEFMAIAMQYIALMQDRVSSGGKLDEAEDDTYHASLRMLFEEFSEGPAKNQKYLAGEYSSLSTDCSGEPEDDM